MIVEALLSQTTDNPKLESEERVIEEKQEMQWICTICGYLHDDEEAPDSCPVCGAQKSRFDEFYESDNDLSEDELDDDDADYYYGEYDE